MSVFWISAAALCVSGLLLRVLVRIGVGASLGSTRRCPACQTVATERPWCENCGVDLRETGVVSGFEGVVGSAKYLQVLLLTAACLMVPEIFQRYVTPFRTQVVGSVWHSSRYNPGAAALERNPFGLEFVAQGRWQRPAWSTFDPQQAQFQSVALRWFRLDEQRPAIEIAVSLSSFTYRVMKPETNDARDQPLTSEALTAFLREALGGGEALEAHCAKVVRALYEARAGFWDAFHTLPQGTTGRLEPPHEVAVPSDSDVVYAVSVSLWIAAMLITCLRNSDRN